MKNITLRAEESLLRLAKAVARSRGETLSKEFRKWLRQYVAQSGNSAAVDALMRRLRHVRSTGPYSRGEMNTR